MVTRKKDEQPGGLEVADVSLRKAVEAIAVKPHAGKLTLLTRKIANVLLAEAQQQGMDQTTYRIALSKLCTQADYDSTNTQLVKDQLRKMASTTIEWNQGAKGSRRWGVTNMLSVEIIEEKGRCFIEWDYPAKLKANLLTPSVYARLSLQMQSNFRSSAALALYEICVRYVDNPGGGLTMRMPWQDWRPTLTGVPDDDAEAGAYKEYKYFKRDVLNKSVAELNAITDLSVELIEHKTGRSVSDLQFVVKAKRQAGLGLDDPNIFDLNLVNRLLTLGFTQQQAEKLYSEHDEIKLRAALDYVEKRLTQKTGEKIGSPVAYFRNALAKGYGNVPPGQRLAALHKKAEAHQKEKPAQVASAEQVKQQLLAAWKAEKSREAREAYEIASPAVQLEMQEAFLATVKLPDILKRWPLKKLDDKLCAAAFTNWLVRDLQAPSEAELFDFSLRQGLLTTS